MTRARFSMDRLLSSRRFVSVVVSLFVWIALHLLPNAASGQRTALLGLDSLRVSRIGFQRAESYALHETEEGLYLDLGDLGRVTGSGFTWNPETYRGSFVVDSALVGFTLDSPLLWIAGRATQLAAPVRYAEESVRVPLDVLPSILVPRYGDRARWDAELGRLSIGGRKPWLERIDVSQSANRIVLALTLEAEVPYRIGWDGRGALSVSVRGLSLPPGWKPPNPRATDIERLDVAPFDGGVVTRLRLAPGWIAARVDRGASDLELRIELSRSARDLSLPGFRRLGDFPPLSNASRLGQPRRILLEVASHGGEGTAYLESLAAALESALTMDFGHQVARIADREATADSEVGPIPDADCWIGLRLENYPLPEQREFLLVTPGAAVREETITEWDALRPSDAVRVDRAEQEAAATGRARGESELELSLPVPWGQASRLAQAPSRTLAQSLADHLASEMADRRVRIWKRPARIFRGVAIPAVLLYPACEGDQAGIAELSSPENVLRAARTIAFGIDEFLLARGER